MQWFKHDTSANMDAKLQEVLLDYGLEGYGLYWYCIELIAGKIGLDNVTFALEHDARVIARNTGSTVQKVEEMMKRFVDAGLFEASDGVITCMKLARRLDQSMSGNSAMRALISKVKKGDHDQVMTESCKNRIDKNRIDKNRVSDSDVPAKPKPRKQFTAPDSSEVFDYMLTRGIPPTVASEESEKFVDHFTSNGWRVSGKTPMKCWMASVRNWSRNIKQPMGVTNGSQNGNQPRQTSMLDRVKQQAEQRARAQETSAAANREFSVESVAEADSDVRLQVLEPVRGDAGRDVDNVLNGDYWQADGERLK